MKKVKKETGKIQNNLEIIHNNKTGESKLINKETEPYDILIQRRNETVRDTLSQGNKTRNNDFFIMNIIFIIFIFFIFINYNNFFSCF